MCINDSRVERGKGGKRNFRESSYKRMRTRQGHVVSDYLVSSKIASDYLVSTEIVSEYLTPSADKHQAHSHNPRVLTEYLQCCSYLWACFPLKAPPCLPVVFTFLTPGVACYASLDAKVKDNPSTQSGG